MVALRGFLAVLVDSIGWGIGVCNGWGLELNFLHVEQSLQPGKKYNFIWEI